MLSTGLMQITGFALAFSMVASAGNSIQAAERLGSNVLISSCKAYAAAQDSRGDLCHAYLQGMLSQHNAGVVLEESGWTSRASRTRAGQLIDRATKHGQDYCLPTDVALLTIMEYIIQENQDLESNHLTAQQLVSTTLARHFPCGTER